MQGERGTVSTELTGREEKGGRYRDKEMETKTGQEPALTKTETERRRSEIDKGWESPRGDRDWVGEVPNGEKRVGREPEGVKEHPPFGVPAGPAHHSACPVPPPHLSPQNRLSPPPGQGRRAHLLQGPSPEAPPPQAP